MTEVVTSIAAPRERVFDALSDARSLRYFVTGARTIRRFDANWPAPGSEVHHSIGVGPFVLRDRTFVTACEEPVRLELEAHARWLGRFLVAFELRSPEEDRTELSILERPISGPLSVPAAAPLAESFLKLRNAEMARRLRRLIEHREQQRAKEAGRG